MTEFITTGLTVQFNFLQGADPLKLYEVSGTGLTGTFKPGAGTVPTWVDGGTAVEFNANGGHILYWPSEPSGVIYDVNEPNVPVVWFAAFLMSDLTWDNGFGAYVFCGNGINMCGVNRIRPGLKPASLSAQDYAATANEIGDTTLCSMNTPILVACRRRQTEMAQWTRWSGHAVTKVTLVTSPQTTWEGNKQMNFGDYWAGVVGPMKGKGYWAQWNQADLSDADVVQNMQAIADRLALRGVTV